MARTPDAELTHAARAGDRRAQAELFRRHYPRILRLSQRLLGRAEDAEENTQDVFVEALRSLCRLEDETAFGRWLASICAHRARTRIRSQTLWRRLGVGDGIIEPDDLAAPTAPAEIVHELYALRRALHAVRDEVRMALLSRQVERMSIREIAKQMDCSEATVKRRLVEAKAWLDQLDR